MKTFLINLDRDTDRLAAVKQRLDAGGVSFERVSAVYGKDLSQEEKDRVVNRLRFRMSMGRGVFDGEIGCALSHAKIYQKMIDENIPLACVLEDDVVVKGDMKGALDATEQLLNCSKSQVVLLSSHGRVASSCSSPTTKSDTLHSPPPPSTSTSLPNLTLHSPPPPSTSASPMPFSAECLSSAMATEAYVLTLPAAKALLKCLVPMKCACDMWGRWVELGAIELYGVVPAVANQAWDVFESHIKPKGKAKRFAGIRVLSGVGKVLDRFLLTIERV